MMIGLFWVIVILALVQVFRELYSRGALGVLMWGWTRVRKNVAIGGNRLTTTASSAVRNTTSYLRARETTTTTNDNNTADGIDEGDEDGGMRGRMMDFLDWMRGRGDLVRRRKRLRTLAEVKRRMKREEAALEGSLAVDVNEGK